MKIVIVALSGLSIGELHNAICVAHQLIKQGAEVLFLTPANHLEYTRTAGMQAQTLNMRMRQRDTLQHVVETFHPDGLILADFHNLDLEMELIDVEALAMLPIPCATFDSMSFGPEKRTLFNRIIRSEDEKRFRGKYQRYTTLRAIPDHMALFRTCPLNSPVPPHGRLRSIKLYDAPFTITAEKRREVRQRLGIMRDEEKLVLFAKASWATLVVQFRLAQAQGSFNSVTFTYETFLQALLIRYLSQVDVPVTVVGVTPDPQKDSILRSQNNIQFLSLPFMDIDKYTEVLFSCDLFITDNLTSCSMAKAVFGQIPVVSLVNTILTGTNDSSPLSFPDNIDFSTDTKELLQHWNRLLPGGIYPFYVYPNGWIEELIPLLRNNSYFNIVPRSEIFAIEETANLFAQLLCDKEQIKRVQKQQATYIQSILSLPNTYDVMSAWLNSH